MQTMSWAFLRGFGGKSLRDVPLVSPVEMVYKSQAQRRYFITFNWKLEKTVQKGIITQKLEDNHEVCIGNRLHRSALHFLHFATCRCR